MPHLEAAAISLGQRVAAAAVDEHACRYSGDNICGVSNDKAQVCGIWGVCRAMTQ